MTKELKEYLHEKLMQGIRNNSFEDTKNAILLGADPAYLDSQALKYIVLSPVLGINFMKLVLEFGADKNAEDGYAIVNCSYMNKWEELNYLIEIGADVTVRKNQLLYDMARHGKIKIVKKLLLLGCDPLSNRCEALHNATFSGNMDLIELLIEKGCRFDNSMLRGIIESKNYEIFLLGVKNGIELEDIKQSGSVWLDKCITTYSLEKSLKEKNHEFGKFKI